MAQKLAGGLKALGYTFLTDSPTNQIFPILPDALIRVLEERYAFYVWSRIDESCSAIRLVTSWATQADRVDEFIEVVRTWSEIGGGPRPWGWQAKALAKLAQN